MIVHHQKCIRTQKPTKFTPVQRKNMQRYLTSKVVPCFRDFSDVQREKKKHMLAILTFYFSQFLKKAWQQAEASVVKINFNSNRIQKTENNFLIIKVSAENLSQISGSLYVSGKLY